MKQILVLGAGATALEIGEALARQRREGADVEALGFLDDDPRAPGLPEMGLPVLGGLDQVHRFPGALFVLGVASYRKPRLRRELTERLGLPAERYYTFVHPSAQVSGTASLGPGCALMHNVLVNKGVRLEAQVLIAQGCCLGHDTEVGSCTVFAPGVTVCGRTHIGENVYVGAGATTAPGIEIGSDALIGIGSVVLESVESGTTVFGNPARVIQKGSRERWTP